MNKLLENAFVPVTTIKQEITFKDQATGKNVKTHVYVKPLSYAAALEDLQSIGESRPDAIARRIAYHICDEIGQAIFTPEQIKGTANPEQGALSKDLTIELLRAIGEASSLGKTEA